MKGIPLHPPQPTQDLFTDASTVGWGATLGPHHAQGIWNSREKVLSINNLEMLAVLRASHQFQGLLQNKVTRLHSDNTTVVSYLKKEGGTQSTSLTELTSQILKWYDSVNAQIQPVHIAGHRNVYADSLSRAGVTQLGEWSLSSKEMQLIHNQLGYPQVDLMATARNTQAPSFISPVPDQKALGTDVFQTRWPTHLLLYVFPPPVLVGRIVQLMKTNAPLRIILVASTLPTKVYHPELLELATSPPVPVARRPQSLWQELPGIIGTHFHPCPEKLSLGAWMLQA